MTTVVNFFGQPGAGKSTHAAKLFAHMKEKSINCELVTEYAKRITWSGTQSILQNQLYVFAKQHNAQFWLNGKVDYVITDSPLLMSLHYGSFEGDIFKELVRKKNKEFNNVNFFVKRTKIYNPIGRNQNESESDDIGNRMLDILTQEKVPLTVITSDTSSEYIMNIINKSNFHHAYMIPGLDSLNDIGALSK